MKLYYDKQADVLYLSQGKPSPKDKTLETSGDVLLRVDSKSKRVRSFTMLNASKRQEKMFSPIALPIEMQMSMA